MMLWCCDQMCYFVCLGETHPRGNYGPFFHCLALFFGCCTLLCLWQRLHCTFITETQQREEFITQQTHQFKGYKSGQVPQTAANTIKQQKAAETPEPVFSDWGMCMLQCGLSKISMDDMNLGCSKLNAHVFHVTRLLVAGLSPPTSELNCCCRYCAPELFSFDQEGVTPALAGLSGAAMFMGKLQCPPSCSNIVWMSVW